MESTRKLLIQMQVIQVNLDTRESLTDSSLESLKEGSRKEDNQEEI